MKIVHVNLARGFRGGERQTVTLIQALGEQYPDLQQILVCRADSPMREMLHNHPVSFVSAEKQWQGHRAVAHADCIHAHEAKAVHWAWLHHLWWQTPYVLTRRVDFPLKNHFLGAKTYGSAHTVVAISQTVREKMLAFSRNVKIISDAYSKLPEKNQTIELLKEKFAKKFVIGNVAALVKEKGQGDLLAVARQFHTQHPDCAFIFLGKGEDEAFFRQQSADLPNVHWLGFQSDVGSYLKMMDLFVFPSHTEGLGSALLDAMVYDVPIVASRVGGIPDIIQHENNGLLFKVGNVAALTQQIERMLREPDFRQHCAVQAKTRLHSFSPEKMAQQYYEIYQQIDAQSQIK